MIYMSDWKWLNEERLAKIYPVLAARIRAFLADMWGQEIPVLVTRGFATYAEQASLYAKGRTTPCKIVTNAKPGYSSHNFGLAVDVVPDDVQKPGLQPDWNADHPVWKTMLIVAAQHGLNEGANWKSFPDKPHLYLAELQDTPTDEMRALLIDKGLAAVWSLIDEKLKIKA